MDKLPIIDVIHLLEKVVIQLHDLARNIAYLKSESRNLRYYSDDIGCVIKELTLIEAEQ